MSKLILDRVQTAMDELTKVQFALRRELAGRVVMPRETMYKHLINAADECETARIELAKRMVRQVSPVEAAD
jgi:collagenase-like PrtC family protease